MIEPRWNVESFWHCQLVNACLFGLIWDPGTSRVVKLLLLSLKNLTNKYPAMSSVYILYIAHITNDFWVSLDGWCSRINMNILLGGDLIWDFFPPQVLDFFPRFSGCSTNILFLLPIASNLTSIDAYHLCIFAASPVHLVHSLQHLLPPSIWSTNRLNLQNPPIAGCFPISQRPSHHTLG